MTQEQWTAVDDYVSDLLAPHDAALESALAAAQAAGLPAIQVSPPQGPFDFTFIDADKENSPAYISPGLWTIRGRER